MRLKRFLCRVFDHRWTMTTVAAGYEPWRLSARLSKPALRCSRCGLIEPEAFTPSHLLKPTLHTESKP